MTNESRRLATKKQIFATIAHVGWCECRKNGNSRNEKQKQAFMKSRILGDDHFTGDKISGEKISCGVDDFISGEGPYYEHIWGADNKIKPIFGHIFSGLSKHDFGGKGDDNELCYQGTFREKTTSGTTVKLVNGRPICSIVARQQPRCC